MLRQKFEAETCHFHKKSLYQRVCQREEEAEEKKAHGGTGGEAHCCQGELLEKGKNPPLVSISRIALHLKLCINKLTTLPGLCTIAEYLTKFGRKRKNRHKICEFIYSLTCKLHTVIYPFLSENHYQQWIIDRLS